MVARLNALIKFRCPRCYIGRMFTSNPYSLSKSTEMPKECACCGQVTEPEPGFYFGAMFSSYVICVGIFLIDFFIFGVFMDFSPIKFLTIYISQLLILMPFIFRYARMTFIYLVVKYDKDAPYKNKK